MSKLKKITLFAVLMFVGPELMAAAGGGDLQGKLTGWKTTVTTAMNTLVAIYAVVGGFLVFVQYMQGSEQAQKNLIKFVIGLAVFGVAGALVNTFAGTAGGAGGV